MKTASTLNQLLGGLLEDHFPRLKSFFSSGTFPIGPNALFAGSFLTLILFNFSLETNAAVIHPTRTPTAKKSLAEIVHLSVIKEPYLPHVITPTPTFLPTSTPSPEESDEIDPLPDEVLLDGMKGHRQSMPLSCEARSAVDWAAFFGKSIDEHAFFNGLPRHDNPDKGFVGDVYGSWGQIPPFPYGVHAKPIAQRLREYGLNAKGVQDMSFQAIREELASGQPVIVWVVGHVNLGTPVPYTASGGAETVVAKFEHTVIVIGYTENKVTFLDGAKVYTRYIGEFKKSWGVLGNQAVIWLD